MRLVVQKFGGSSLATRELRQRVVSHISAATKDGVSPVVVVSAMGRQGDAYATDTMLAMIREITPTPADRETDLILSCGEIISAAMLAIELQSMGMPAVALTGWQAGIVSDGVFTHAEIIRIKKDHILKLVMTGVIPVVAGFQGVSEDGEVNTLGRGGSDTTAVALGAAIAAEMVEIYSDVDSVMTADPRLVPEARPIKNIGYQEVLQLAREGAKVIHPRAVDIALQYNLPISLRKTGEGSAGTLVTHKKAIDDKGFIARDRVVNGITHITGLAQIRLHAPQAAGQEIETILEKISETGISIDLINLSPFERMFTVPAQDAQKTAEILSSLGYEPQVKAGFAKVSVVGTGMRGIPGVMARVVKALNRAGTEILQTADSHLNISCLIPERKVGDAVKALHLEFRLDI
ncbi:MAG: aspartate kinase [Clostridiales bacterium]|jgi:aspartate kinase|nr:aspartate kinase [Clostridiales bacterium]